MRHLLLAVYQSDLQGAARRYGQWVSASRTPGRSQGSAYSPRLGTCAHLVERHDARAEPAVDAEDLAVDDGAEGEVVKDVAAVAPDVCAPVLG
jgi:hypothetical protein